MYLNTLTLVGFAAIISSTNGAPTPMGVVRSVSKRSPAPQVSVSPIHFPIDAKVSYIPVDEDKYTPHPPVDGVYPLPNPMKRQVDEDWPVDEYVDIEDYPTGPVDDYPGTDEDYLVKRQDGGTPIDDDWQVDNGWSPPLDIIKYTDPVDEEDYPVDAEWRKKRQDGGPVDEGYGPVDTDYVPIEDLEKYQIDDIDYPGAVDDYLPQDLENYRIKRQNDPVDDYPQDEDYGGTVDDYRPTLDLEVYPTDEYPGDLSDYLTKRQDVPIDDDYPADLIFYKLDEEEYPPTDKDYPILDDDYRAKHKRGVVPIGGGCDPLDAGGCTPPEDVDEYCVDDYYPQPIDGTEAYPVKVKRSCSAPLKRSDPPAVKRSYPPTVKRQDEPEPEPEDEGYSVDVGYHPHLDLIKYTIDEHWVPEDDNYPAKHKRQEEFGTERRVEADGTGPVPW